MNTRSTTITHIGAIQTFKARLSIGYVHDGEGLVHLHASDPTDGRKSGVFLSLTTAQYAELKLLLSKVDKTIADASEKRKSEVEARRSASRRDDGQVVVQLPGSEIVLPADLYARAVEQITQGNTLAAALLITESIPWLGSTGAVLVAAEISSLVCPEK